MAWISNTTGDDDGVDLTLEAPPDAVLRFRTPVIDLDVPAGGSRHGAHAAHSPRAASTCASFMRRLPARGFTRGAGVRRHGRSPAARPCHAYWIRVTQEDGAQAWTSPVYLDAAR